MKIFESRLKFVAKIPINNIPALVQIMAWRRLGDKPLSEPMTVNLLTHICVTWPQWIKAVPLHYSIRSRLCFFKIISLQSKVTWVNHMDIKANTDFINFAMTLRLWLRWVQCSMHGFLLVVSQGWAHSHRMCSHRMRMCAYARRTDVKDPQMTYANACMTHAKGARNLCASIMSIPCKCAHICAHYGRQRRAHNAYECAHALVRRPAARKTETVKIGLQSCFDSPFS